MKKVLILTALIIQSVFSYCQALYIYGGENHDVFLGILNGSKFDSKSVWNEFGTYGNKYNSLSIWNEYGRYGNSYSQYSPFNPYASHPPVIVDPDGNFYGYLTVNQYKSQGANFDIANIICEYNELHKGRCR